MGSEPFVALRMSKHSEDGPKRDEEIAFECVGKLLEGLNELHRKLPDSMINRLESFFCEVNETIGSDESPYFEHDRGDKTRSFFRGT